MSCPPFCFLSSANYSCPPAIVNLNLSKTLEEAKVVFTPDLIELKAEVNHSVCSSSTEGTWHITQATLKSKVFTDFLPAALNTTQPCMTMRRPNSLRSYFYVSYILKLSSQKVIGYDFGYIKLLQVPVAIISGVHFATKGDGNITLDGTLSHDPETLPLTFTWFCRRSYEMFAQNDSLVVVDVPTGQSSSSEGCYGYGPGRLSAIKNTLVVDVDKMEANQTYVFKLVVSNGLRSSNIHHRLTIQQRQRIKGLLINDIQCFFLLFAMKLTLLDGLN